MIWQCQDRDCGELLDRYQIATHRRPSYTSKPLYRSDGSLAVPAHTFKASVIRRCPWCRGNLRLIPLAELPKLNRRLRKKVRKLVLKQRTDPTDHQRRQLVQIRRLLPLTEKPNPRFYALACKRVA